MSKKGSFILSKISIMKRLLLILPLAILFSCGNNEADTKEPIVKSEATSADDPAPAKMVWPTYALPVEFVDWSIGDTSNSRKVVDMYKAWDEKDPKKIASFFSDSTAYDLPDGTRAATTNENVYETFRRWRGYF